MTIAGGTLQSYGLLCHAKSIHEGDKSGPLSHKAMVRERSYHNGAAALVGTANETYASENDPFCFTFEYSFLGSCAPSIIDTSLIPDMVLCIQLHGNEVLTSVGGPQVYAHPVETQIFRDRLCCFDGKLLAAVRYRGFSLAKDVVALCGV